MYAMNVCALLSVKQKSRDRGFPRSCSMEIISRERDLALEKQHGGLITDRRADGNEFDVALDELR